MKTNLCISAAACALFLFGPAVLAQSGGGGGGSSAPTIDPLTGLPLSASRPAEPTWIAPNWPDPGIVLTNVSFGSAGIPLSEVVNVLRRDFKDTFDILPIHDSLGNEWGNTIVNLELHNVTASEAFNAMNLVFENDRTPLRWELKMNYDRPIARLLVLPEALVPKVRRVFFVGDLLGDEKSGGLTMGELVQMVKDIWHTAYNSEDNIQFYNQAQLLIVNGTPEQAGFVQQTLEALGDRAKWERFKQSSAGASSTPDGLKNGPKPGGSGGGS